MVAYSRRHGRYRSCGGDNDALAAGPARSGSGESNGSLAVIIKFKSGRDAVHRFLVFDTLANALSMYSMLVHSRADDWISGAVFLVD